MVGCRGHCSCTLYVSGDVQLRQCELDECMGDARPLCAHFGASAKQGMGDARPTTGNVVDLGKMCGWPLLARVVLNLIKEHCTTGGVVSTDQMRRASQMDHDLVQRMLLAQDHVLEPWSDIWRLRLSLLYLRACDGYMLLHRPVVYSLGKIMSEWGPYARVGVTQTVGVLEILVQERRAATSHIFVGCQSRGVDGQTIRGVGLVHLNVLDEPVDAEPARLVPGARVCASRVHFEPAHGADGTWVRYVLATGAL
jgi:hypothetical protein